MEASLMQCRVLFYMYKAYTLSLCSRFFLPLNLSVFNEGLHSHLLERIASWPYGRLPTST